MFLKVINVALWAYNDLQNEILKITNLYLGIYVLVKERQKKC